jgi:sigma-B regulation protein RsbU (phosphoserine phosphatase)
MGKGMPASMLMASLQASLRIIIPESTSPCDVLDRVNQVFCHNIHLTKFVTIVVAELDPRTGIIRYANAGHNPPIVLRRPDGPGGPQTELLMPTSTAIGLLEKATLKHGRSGSEKATRWSSYTDGGLMMHSGDAVSRGPRALWNAQWTPRALMQVLRDPTVTSNARLSTIRQSW